MAVPDWDSYFMTMVYLVSTRSKDESSKLGAVVVGPDNEVRSIGYNSFVRGINDYVPGRQQRPEKYLWFEHAERNAIYNAVLIGVSLKGCKMYTNGIPCADCARAVINSGIKEVIVDSKWAWHRKRDPKWDESHKRSLKMFEEAGINLRFFKGKFVKMQRVIGGRKKKL